VQNCGIHCLAIKFIFIFAATSDLMTEEHVQMKRNCSIQKFEDGGGLPPLAALQDLFNGDL
jgi:hypothetical protein